MGACWVAAAAVAAAIAGHYVVGGAGSAGVGVGVGVDLMFLALFCSSVGIVTLLCWSVFFFGAKFCLVLWVIFPS